MFNKYLGRKNKKIYTFNGESGLLITTGSYGEENPFYHRIIKAIMVKLFFKFTQSYTKNIF